MPKPTETCQHVRTNGTFCKSPAVTGHRLCYFHKRDRDRQVRLLNNLEFRRGAVAHGRVDQLIAPLPGSKTAFDDNSAELFSELHIPVLEDADAIQVCLSDLYRAIATQQIDMLVAGRLLYTLQIAALNLKNTHFDRDPQFYPRATEDESSVRPFTPYAESPIHKKLGGGDSK
jgi:hypothetical protein